MSEPMIIDGEEYEIYPDVWEVFQDWYGDKAYRQAGFVEDIQMQAIASYLEAKG